MEKKNCSNCLLEKSKDEFYKDKSKKSGLSTFCKLCRKELGKKYYSKNSDKIKSKAKEYREGNPDKIKLYRIENKEKINALSKKSRERNIENIRVSQKKYYLENKEKIISRYYQNREKEIERMKKWKKENRLHLREYSKKYNSERKKVDYLFKLRYSIKSLIYVSIRNKGLKKQSKTQLILGCSFSEFKHHLESKFEPWMSWENYGLYNGTKNYGWDIDHIIPMSSAVDEDDVIRLNHYTNLQPLCSYTNRYIKSGKTDYCDNSFNFSLNSSAIS